MRHNGLWLLQSNKLLEQTVTVFERKNTVSNVVCAQATMELERQDIIEKHSLTLLEIT